MKLCFIDTETTGLKPEASIHQISGIIIGDGIYKEFNIKCKPFTNSKMEPGAIGKTGITDEIIETYQSQEDGLKEFISVLDECGIGKVGNGKDGWANRAQFIGYNANFDMTKVREWFEFNHKMLSAYFFYPYIDVMTLAGFYLIGKRPFMKDFKQITVYTELFNEPFEDAHDALADVKACKRIFDFLSNKLLAPMMEIKTRQL